MQGVDVFVRQYHVCLYFFSLWYLLLQRISVLVFIDLNDAFDCAFSPILRLEPDSGEEELEVKVEFVVSTSR